MTKCRCKRTNSKVECATEVSNGSGGKRKTHLHHWVHSQSKTIAFLSCTLRGLSRCTGSLPTFSANAHAMHLSRWGMHSAAPREVFQHWGITRSETSQPTSWPKCAKMTALGLSFRSCQANYCTMLLPPETMEPMLTFGFIGSGANSHGGHSLMWQYSIPMHCSTGNSTLTYQAELCQPLSWEGETTILWAAHPRSRTWLLHTTRALHIWRHKISDYNRLQVAHLTAFLKVWTAMQHSHDMAKLPLVVLTPEIHGQVLEGSMVKHWTCCIGCTSRGLSCSQRACAPFLIILSGSGFYLHHCTFWLHSCIYCTVSDFLFFLVCIFSW